ncbi:hypothetical protein pb186bvf_018167 [Paramecium bursaria]
MISLFFLIRTITGYNFSTSTLCAPDQCNTARNLLDCISIQYCQWTGSLNLFSQSTGGSCIPAFCADQSDAYSCNFIYGCYYSSEGKCTIANPLEKYAEIAYGEVFCNTFSANQCKQDTSCFWVINTCRAKLCSDITVQKNCGQIWSENDILQCRWQNNLCTDPTDLSYLSEAQCNVTSLNTHYWDDGSNKCLPCSGIEILMTILLYLF